MTVATILPQSCPGTAFIRPSFRHIFAPYHVNKESREALARTVPED